MLIEIEVAPPLRISPTPLSPNSGFVSFPYCPEVIAYIKDLPTRTYLADRKVWEIPEHLIAKLCNDLTAYDIEIAGEMALAPSLNNVLPKNVTFKTKPFNHQIEGVIYGIDHPCFLLGDDQGLGKALALNTKIYTPRGYKEIKDIKVGDTVFNEEGKFVFVKNVFNHTDVKMRRITFLDGKHIDCCEDHLWFIYDQGIPRVVDTKWFDRKNHNGVRRRDALRNKTNFNYSIPRCAPVQFSKQFVELAPYVMGCLLGDGGLTQNSVGFTSCDSYIIDKMNSLLPNGYILNSSISMESISYNIVKETKDKKNNEVIRYLRRINLMGCNSHTKFIPDCYKYNTVESRIAVIQGLLDTDGYAADCNLLQYTTVSRKLADDMTFMIESIGGLVTERTDICRVGEQITGEAYTLTIKVDDPSLLVTLPRKKEKLSPRKFKANRQIIRIDDLPNAPAKCIEVDGKSHLYLAEHFIVTHNTKQIIDLAVYRKKNEGIKHCLIICGVNGIKYNWENEVAIHSEEDSWVLGTRWTKRAPRRKIEGSSADKLYDLQNLPANAFFIITNIETLRGLSTMVKKKRQFPIAEEINKLCQTGQIGMVILDEAHKCKEPTSQQSKALLHIDSKYKIPLSGTFLMNNPLDLYMPLKWTGFETHSFYEYKQYYCVMGGYMGTEIVGYRNLATLQETLARVMLRRTKEEVLDLPPKIHSYDFVEMTQKQQAVYDDVKKDIQQHINKVIVSDNPLAQLIRLRQATGHTGILSTEISLSAKTDRMEEIVEEVVSVGGKCVIFSQWEQVTARVKYLLAKYKPAYIVGDVAANERMEQVRRFQEDKDCSVIIGTIGAMGTGLTLSAASTVIFLDEPWNRALKDQAEDRAHRIGTKGTVSVITLICKDTIDERIMELVYKKGKMADLLLDSRMEVTNKTALVDYLLS